MDFATEFALMSRNIHFESEDLTNPANGAYLTILSTRSIPQLLQGVAFNGFGQQGIANRFVSILFIHCFALLPVSFSKRRVTSFVLWCITSLISLFCSNHVATLPAP
jgi:hypothetical protein